MPADGPSSDAALAAAIVPMGAGIEARGLGGVGRVDVLDTVPTHSPLMRFL